VLTVLACASILPELGVAAWAGHRELVSRPEDLPWRGPDRGSTHAHLDDRVTESSRTLLPAVNPEKSSSASAGRKVVEWHSPVPEKGYKGGVMKSVGHVLEDGTKVGRWTEWSYRGRVVFNGTYKNGQRWEGWESEWGEYLDVINEGDFKTTEGYWKNGQRQGFWSYCEDRGRSEASGRYKDGQRIGRWTEYCLVGKDQHGEMLSVEGQMGPDGREGVWTCWSSDGTIHEETSGFYKAGERIAPLPKKSPPLQTNSHLARVVPGVPRR
jgi:hypothetical protein